MCCDRCNRRCCALGAPVSLKSHFTPQHRPMTHLRCGKNHAFLSFSLFFANSILMLKICGFVAKLCVSCVWRWKSVLRPILPPLRWPLRLRPVRAGAHPTHSTSTCVFCWKCWKPAKLQDKPFSLYVCLCFVWFMCVLCSLFSNTAEVVCCVFCNAFFLFRCRF
jgi:hypothetical protein